MRSRQERVAAIAEKATLRRRSNRGFSSTGGPYSVCEDEAASISEEALSELSSRPPGKGESR